MSNIFNDDNDTTSLSFTTNSDGLLSQEDRQNLDRLLTSSSSLFPSSTTSSLFSNTSPTNHSTNSNSLDDFTSSKSAYHIQASSATLLNDSQMGFAFLKHKVYNYDGGFQQEDGSDNKLTNQKLNAHGLFENTPDNDNDIINETGQNTNNLFKDDTRSKKPSTNKPSTAQSQNQNKVNRYFF